MANLVELTQANDVMNTLFRNVSRTLCLFGLVFLSACKDESPSAIDEPLIITFTIKDQFQQESDTFLLGEEISFEVKVKNPGNKVVSYFATGPGMGVGVWSDETNIWLNDFGIVYAQVITERFITAHSTVIGKYIWIGVNNQGEVVLRGEYQAKPNLVFFVDGERIPEPESKTINLQ